MFSMSWVKRSSLKAGAKRSDTLLLRQGPGKPSAVAVTAVAALFVAVGASMYVRVSADQAQTSTAGVPSGAVVTSVDGSVFPSDGDFDMTYLANGSHDIGYQQPADTAAVDHKVLVNNNTGPLEALRNTVFAGMHGNKTAVDQTLGWIFLFAGLLLLGAAWWWLKQVRGGQGRGRV
jgi:hypothetical protein